MKYIEPKDLINLDDEFVKFVDDHPKDFDNMKLETLIELDRLIKSRYENN